MNFADDPDRDGMAPSIRPKGFGLLTMVYPPYFFRQRRANHAITKVPINDASWIGSQLAQLSDDQLRDSFRAAGYDAATTEGYVRTLRHRINELNQLKQSDLARGRRPLSVSGSYNRVLE